MAPDDAALSLFKRPFAAYDTGGAVYIAYGNFASMACSPVDGEVVDIREYLSEAVTTISGTSPTFMLKCAHRMTMCGRATTCRLMCLLMLPQLKKVHR